MKIILTNRFLRKLGRQISYIADDSPQRARKFKKELFISINKLKTNSFKFRKSIYFDSVSRRDLIFKGYVITYEIFDDRIEIIGFNKY